MLSNQTLSPFFVFYGTATLFLEIIYSMVTSAKREAILFLFGCSEVNRSAREKHYSLVWYILIVVIVVAVVVVVVVVVLVVVLVVLVVLVVVVEVEVEVVGVVLHK